ncbi:MAG: DUF2318 domain-containing protein [Coriobacteriales bacterium]|nr:DUF2318 domain-containing protein [Coriobacteriales bacterium]
MAKSMMRKRAVALGCIGALLAMLVGLPACDAAGPGAQADANADANGGTQAAQTDRPAAADTNRAAATPSGEDVVIPLADITEQARFYPADVEGTALEVLAVKAPDGSVRTAFNTCQVCFDSGRGYYVQEGDVLVCQNCGNRFALEDVEIQTGGCNPVPIFEGDKATGAEEIVVPAETLAAAKPLFADWKR